MLLLLPLLPHLRLLLLLPQLLLPLQLLLLLQLPLLFQVLDYFLPICLPCIFCNLLEDFLWFHLFTLITLP